MVYALGECDVAAEIRLCDGIVPGDAFGEDTPGDLLGNGDVSGGCMR